MKRVIVSTDLAFKRHASACVVVETDDIARTARVPFAREWRPTRHRALVPSEVCTEVVRIAKEYGAEEVAADVHYIETLREHTTAAGLAIRDVDNSKKEDAYTFARVLFLERRIALVRHEELTRQLRDTLFAPRKGGRIEIIAARGGGHGDIVSALVGGLYVVRADLTTDTPRAAGAGSARWEKAADPWDDEDEDDAPAEYALRRF